MDILYLGYNSVEEPVLGDRGVAGEGPGHVVVGLPCSTTGLSIFTVMTKDNTEYRLNIRP